MTQVCHTDEVGLVVREGQKFHIALFTYVMKETLSLLFLEKHKSLKAIMAGNLEKVV